MDLLSPSSKPLRINEDPSKGVVVVAGLTEKVGGRRWLPGRGAVFFDGVFFVSALLSSLFVCFAQLDGLRSSTIISTSYLVRVELEVERVVISGQILTIYISVRPF